MDKNTYIKENFGISEYVLNLTDKAEVKLSEQFK